MVFNNPNFPYLQYGPPSLEKEGGCHKKCSKDEETHRNSMELIFQTSTIEFYEKNN